MSRNLPTFSSQISKKDEPGVVEAYEKILSGQLSSGVAATDVEGDPDNIIEKTAVMRKDQMKRLVDEGRVRAEKVAAIKENINKGHQTVQSSTGRYFLGR